MTQAEIDAEIESLRAQVSQLQQQQEGQKKHWTRWSLICGGIGVAVAIVGAVIAMIAAAGPIPPLATILGFSSLQLCILCFAFAAAGRLPGG